MKEAMTETIPPFMELYRLGTAFYASQALYVAAHLGIADHVADAPQTAEALAKTTDCHPDALRRVLRLLVSARVFDEDEEGRFSSTEMGACLREGPGSFRPFVRLFCGSGLWRVWGDLLSSVRTGEPALKRIFGVGPFEYFAQGHEEAVNFDRAMSSYTAITAQMVATAYDFSSMRSLVDLGGGNGALLTGLLAKHTHLRGTVFDLPRLSAKARTWIADAGLADRCDFVGGDFFEAVPEGADAYLLKYVIHDWDDAHACDILKTVRRAMSDGAKVLIVESVYPERIDTTIEGQGAARNDCNMLVVTGGRQRTEQEFRDLYAAAGLRLARIVPTPMACVIEAEPV